MKQTFITGVALVVVGSMAMVGNAMALSMSLLDSTSTVTGSETGLGNLNSAKGGLAFIGGIGSWTTNISSGVSNPIIGTFANQALDLDTLNISSSIGETLTISFVAFKNFGFNKPKNIKIAAQAEYTVFLHTEYFFHSNYKEFL
jgi:hypothetical protein